MALIDKLTAIGDGFRASRGTAQKYSLEEMAVMAAEKVGGGDGSPRVVENKVNLSVSVSAEGLTVPDTYALYNGERLPEIPESLLSSHPYVFIHKSSSRYNLVFSTAPYYYAVADSSEPDRLDCSGGAVVNLWLTFDDYEAGKPWSVRDLTTYYFENPEGLVWSNYDIPNGSTTATEIYFAGSEPVPTE